MSLAPSIASDISPISRFLILLIKLPDISLELIHPILPSFNADDEILYFITVLKSQCL